MDYSAYRRSNELDQPKPDTLEHEWVILSRNTRADAPVFPDTAQGKADAERVARLLNNTFQRGEIAARNKMREALGF